MALTDNNLVLQNYTNSTDIVDTNTIAEVYDVLVDRVKSTLDVEFTSERLTGDQYAQVLSAQLTQAMTLAVSATQNQEKLKSDTTNQTKITDAQVAKTLRDAKLVEQQTLLVDKQALLVDEQINGLHTDIINKTKVTDAQIAKLLRDAKLVEEQTLVAEKQASLMNNQASLIVTQNEAAKAKSIESTRLSVAQTALTYKQAEGVDTNFRIKGATSFGDTLGLAMSNSVAITAEAWNTYFDMLKEASGLTTAYSSTTTGAPYT